MADPLYPFASIEPKWQKYWAENKTFAACGDTLESGKAANMSPRSKLYILDMFPYPSGAGLHVGHPEGYTATDIYSRFKRMQGYAVLHPMGWDAFGLPAEQYAIETGTHPRETTKKNIAQFRRQIQRLGLSYDWDREVDTTDPEYFRWTQWIFLQLYKKGLAYVAEVPVWWCEALGCVLANEEVVDGKSERGGHPVVRRPMRQWMLKITAYADRLLEDLKLVDWTESIKEQQRNWIGRSEGAFVDFKIDEGAAKNETLKVFTTRPDTLFGATYMVVSPEHPLIDKLTASDRKAEVEKYRAAAAKKSELERTDLAKDKTGVFSGSFAVNPVNGEKIPVWIADYVLAGYGTGAIMAVPAHDDRDWAFAKKFGLKIVRVVSPQRHSERASASEESPGRGDPSAPAAPQDDVFVGDGVNVNSRFLDGLPTPKAKEKMIAWLAEKKSGLKTVNYKLRDWLFSRQRYWGEPIPVVHCAKCGIVPLPESDLPLLLPEMKDFKPSGNAEPPLAKAKEWVNTKCPQCAGPAVRETNTMPQWAGSCWYYLRYIDPKNKEKFVDPAKEKAWMPVDLYVGGAEHAVLHLLYSRFWHKVLYDLGHVSTPEPFMKLVNQGMILGEDNQKMSKSRGNVINPDHIVDTYGADSMRLYEMFMGPLTQGKAWSTKGLEGVYRFLGRVWRLYVKTDESGAYRLSGAVTGRPATEQEKRRLHKTIRAVTEDVEQLEFNTAISKMMAFLNDEYASADHAKEILEKFILLLSPFAPHMAEEIRSLLGYRESLASVEWPKYDPKLVEDDVIEIPVMVNGKVKSVIHIGTNWSESQVEELAMRDQKVLAAIQGGKIKFKKYVSKKTFTIAV